MFWKVPERLGIFLTTNYRNIKFAIKITMKGELAFTIVINLKSSEGYKSARSQKKFLNKIILGHTWRIKGTVDVSGVQRRKPNPLKVDSIKKWRPFND